MGTPSPEEPPRGASASATELAPLSAWLALMLAEIARKREELERARAEQAQRSSEEGS